MTSSADVGMRLRVELARLQPLNPFQVLDLPLEANLDAVRSAFLALTKRYHPNRFARESPETVEVANELFLVIRRAYGQLSDDARRAAWRERVLRSTGPRKTPGRSRPTAPAASAVEAAPLARPPEPPPRAAEPPPRAAEPPPAPRRSLTPPPMAVPPIPPRRPIASPATSAPPPGAGPPVSPATGRTADEVIAMLEAAKTRGQRFDLAQRHLANGRHAAAKELLAKLVAEDPQSRRFRHKFHYASGLDHRDAGRLDEAIRELNRAIALEPDSAETADALRKTQEQRKGGIFSKFFGR